MATWDEQLNAINALRQHRGNNDDRLYNVQIGLQKVGKEAGQERERLQREYKIARAALDSSRVDLHEAIAGIYIDPHPRSAVKNLTDKIPFLLMPVRIETRFVTGGISPELWLRIYPDEISVHTHEKLLTETEVTKGEAYWLAFFEAEKNGGNEKEEQKKTVPPPRYVFNYKVTVQNNSTKAIKETKGTRTKARRRTRRSPS